MAEILKVTSPISVKQRVGNVPSRMPDSIFDMGGTENAVKAVQKPVTDQSGTASQEQNVLDLTKEILRPLQELTSSQAETMKALMSMLKLMSTSDAQAVSKLSPKLLEQIFVNPGELQEALVARDKGETPFKGEAFDILRMLSDALGGKREIQQAGRTVAGQAGVMAGAQAGAMAGTTAGTQPGTPAGVQEAIASILRHFDGIVNQENSLKIIVQQSKSMMESLYAADKQIMNHHINRLETLMDQTGHTGRSAVAGNIEISKSSTEIAREQAAAKLIAEDSVAELNSRDNKEVRQFLKNEFIPMLSTMVSRYQQNENIRNPVMSIIHYIVRFDKGEPRLLNQAIDRLAQELKPVTSLSDGDFDDMRKLIIDAAKDFRKEDAAQNAERKFMAKFGIAPEENDIASLLGKSLEDGAPPKLQSVAMNLLHSLIGSESPVMPLMHFMIPVKYEGENTFVEFFIDKKAHERKGEAQEAKTIFFTVRSEKYGTFEVDLLEKDMMIDLDIKCPVELVEGVRDAKDRLVEDIGAQGYRLAGYQVSKFVREKPILSRFPKLAERKVGIDVKI